MSMPAIPDGVALHVESDGPDDASGPRSPAPQPPAYLICDDVDLDSCTRTGWRLVACFQVDAPATVFDDVAPSEHYTSPQQTPTPFDSYSPNGQGRRARSIVLRQLRFLLRRTDLADPIDGLRAQIAHLEEQLRSCQHRVDDHNRVLEQKDNEARKARERQERLHNQLKSQHDALAADAQNKEKALREQRRIVLTHEEDDQRIRAVLGDALTDRLLDRANTAAAEVLRREVIDALT